MADLKDYYQEGLGALRKEDKPHIRAENPRDIKGSVDVDTAYQKTDPHGNRWDFAIAYQHTNLAKEVIYWVELHTASDSQISKVIAKTKWLLEWLKNEGNPLATFERDIVWVSSGRTRFRPNGMQAKQMAQLGLRQSGNTLQITNNRG